MAEWASPRERRAFGRSRRKQLARVDLARWSAKDRLHSPLALMTASMRGRLPALVTLKYERMMASPFGYFRGAAPVMAADLAQLPHTGIVSFPRVALAYAGDIRDMGGAVITGCEVTGVDIKMRSLLLTHVRGTIEAGNVKTTWK